MTAPDSPQDPLSAPAPNAAHVPTAAQAPTAAQTPDAWRLLEGAQRVLTLQAHPDDETLSTGALLAHLAARGTRIDLVTATRGEEGETVPGSIAPDDARSFVEVRAAELDGATRSLGITSSCFLGSPPALAPGADARRYRDSGMRWVTPQLAGPAEDTGPGAFTRRPVAEAVADLEAAIRALRPDVLLSNDDGGTYGHPDHVHVHTIAARAAAAQGVPLIEVASFHDADAQADDPSFARRELPGTARAVEGALRAHRTQLTVLGPAAAEGAGSGVAGVDAAEGAGSDVDRAGRGSSGAASGIRIVLSGGQERVVPLSAGIRVHREEPVDAR